MANEYSRYGTRSYGLESSRPFAPGNPKFQARRLVLPIGHPALADCGARACLYYIPARPQTPAYFEVYRMYGAPRCFREPHAHLAIRAARERVATEHADPSERLLARMHSRPVERVEPVRFLEAAE